MIDWKDLNLQHMINWEYLSLQHTISSIQWALPCQKKKNQYFTPQKKSVLDFSSVGLQHTCHLRWKY